MKRIEITVDESNQRLDKFILKYYNKAPKSFVYKMLRKKRIKLNAARAQGNEILNAGDIITFHFSDNTMETFKDAFMEERIVNAASDIDIIYEDANIIVCNKPQGALSHSESKDDRDTMVDRFLFYLQNKNEYIPAKESTFTPAICNRLDRNTGGILLCGKNLASLQAINKIIAERKAEKYYLAFVAGKIEASGVLNGFYKKDRSKNLAVIKNDPLAGDVLAEFRPIKTTDEFTLLELRLITGKSHQLRAHLASVSHPIVGDPKYGDAAVNSLMRKKFGIKFQLLHAVRFIMKEPYGHMGYLCNKEFVCDVPSSFNEAVNYYF